MGCCCCCCCKTKLVGLRFNPNDEELVGYYLRHKIQGRDSLVHNIPQVAEFSALEPNNLIETDPNDRIWYFFCPIKYKFPSNNRINRTSTNGFWKITGKDRKIKSGGGGQIGTKKTLVFYAGRFPGTRTPWVMYEYNYAHIDINSLPDQPPKGFVLCKLKKKEEKNWRKEGKGDSKRIISCDKFLGYSLIS